MWLWNKLSEWHLLGQDRDVVEKLREMPTESLEILYRIWNNNYIHKIESDQTESFYEKFNSFTKAYKYPKNFYDQKLSSDTKMYRKFFKKTIFLSWRNLIFVSRDRAKLNEIKLQLHLRLQKQKYFNKWRSNVHDRIKQKDKFDIRRLNQKILDMQEDYRYEHVTRERLQGLHKKAWKDIIKVQKQQVQTSEVIKDLI